MNPSSIFGLPFHAAAWSCFSAFFSSGLIFLSSTRVYWSIVWLIRATISGCLFMPPRDRCFRRSSIPDVKLPEQTTKNRNVSCTWASRVNGSKQAPPINLRINPEVWSLTFIWRAHTKKFGHFRVPITAHFLASCVKLVSRFVVSGQFDCIGSE